MDSQLDYNKHQWT